MNNLRNYLSQLLERLKTCFVFTTLALAEKWVRLCEEWLEDRQEQVVKRAEAITDSCGYVHGIEDKR